jgi:hypothetical protein
VVAIGAPVGLVAQRVPVPPEHQPPAGMCRVWLDGVPAAQQPAPTSCAEAAKVHAPNGRLILGTDQPTPSLTHTVRVGSPTDAAAPDGAAGGGAAGVGVRAVSPKTKAAIVPKSKAPPAPPPLPRSRHR